MAILTGRDMAIIRMMKSGNSLVEERRYLRCRFLVAGQQITRAQFKKLLDERLISLSAEKPTNLTRHTRRYELTARGSSAAD